MQGPNSRRTFVKALGASALLSGIGSRRASAAINIPGQVGVLTGTQFDLTIEEAPVNFTGTRRPAITVNGGIPGPILRWREGDTVTLRVRNKFRETTSIHWHGIVLPANMDGVPGLSFHGIESGGMYVYHFKVKQNGTCWYHSHSAYQEQSGVYGPLVIEAKEPEPFTYDRDYVVMLSDWTDEDPADVARTLKKQSDYYNFHKRTLVDFVRDVKSKGWGATVDDRMMWAEMRMNPTDLADVSGYTYTYLINGTAPEPGWTGIFRRGERVRLRFINGSSMRYFDVRIPGLKMTVVAADGQYVKPVSVDECRIAVAETYDVLVEPAGEDAYTIVAQAMDRTGYARGTLAIAAGRTAPIPSMDPRPLVTMDGMALTLNGSRRWPSPSMLDDLAGRCCVSRERQIWWEERLQSALAQVGLSAFKAASRNDIAAPVGTVIARMLELWSIGLRPYSRQVASDLDEMARSVRP